MAATMDRRSVDAGDSIAADALCVEGTVKLAYPLRQLHAQDAAAVDSFTLGDGPCGRDASQVMTIVLENDR